MTTISDLVSELALNSESCVLIAFAAYPQSGWTGELESIGQVVSGMLTSFKDDGCRAFRLMHGLGVVLMESKDDAVSLVKRIGATCAAPKVEMRALIVQFIGGRDADWLDELLGDLSVRANFGAFSREKVARLIDGDLV